MSNTILIQQTLTYYQNTSKYYITYIYAINYILAISAHIFSASFIGIICFMCDIWATSSPINQVKVKLPTFEQSAMIYMAHTKLNADVQFIQPPIILIPVCQHTYSFVHFKHNCLRHFLCSLAQQSISTQTLLWQKYNGL